MIQVLQVIDSLGLGGAEVLIGNMVPRFRSRGVECDVATLIHTPSPVEQSLRAEHVALYQTGVRSLYSLRQVAPLLRLMKKYDIVHVHLFPAQLWTVLGRIASRQSLRLVTTEHNTWNARRLPWLRPLDTWMYPRFDHIACNSVATEEALIRWCPPAAGNTSVIPNGIPLELFAKAEPVELAGIPPGVPRLVFVGRFDPQKDHATILRALTAIPAAHVLFVGDGPLRSQMEQLAVSLSVAKRVTFLGRRGDVPGILKASDIYVHSTHSDGFGLAACEAMAAGLPVIASDVPGLAQVVEGAGVLFPAGDDAALAREVTALLASPQRRQQMRESSLCRAQLFSIDHTVDGYVELYRSVTRASSRGSKGAT